MLVNTINITIQVKIVNFFLMRYYLLRTRNFEICHLVYPFFYFIKLSQLVLQHLHLLIKIF
jgi:hypothetical protein